VEGEQDVVVVFPVSKESCRVWLGCTDFVPLESIAFVGYFGAGLEGGQILLV
jgi:hypothetical protein